MACCWTIALSPLSIAFVFLGLGPVSALMFLLFLSVKLLVDVLLCWLLVGLHHRHIAPRLTVKALLSQLALAPVYVIGQQLLIYVYVAGIFRALRLRAQPDHANNHAAIW
jgi:hypothetical protein